MWIFSHWAWCADSRLHDYDLCLQGMTSGQEEEVGGYRCLPVVITISCLQGYSKRKEVDHATRYLLTQKIDIDSLSTSRSLTIAIFSWLIVHASPHFIDGLLHVYLWEDKLVWCHTGQT